MRRAILLAIVMASPLALAQSQSDIVWPTYDQVALVGDPLLNCAALQAEVTHVTSDISLLRKAQARVEEALHTAFDMERYGSRNGAGGMRVSAGSVNGKEAYAAARVQIVASLRTAQARRDHLKGLEPDCKPGPQPVSAP